MISRLFLFLLVILCAGCQSKKEEEKKYTIARDASWFPLQLGNNAVKMIGFTNALLSEIAKNQKAPFSISDVSWITLFQGLEDGTFPAIFSSLPINQITASKYSFSDPLILLGPVLVVRANSQARSIDDLSEKIVGVSEFSDGPLIVQKNPTAIIQLYSNMVLALSDLEKGSIDAVLIDTLDAHAIIPAQFAGVLKIVSKPLNERGIRILTLKDKKLDVISHFNKGLSNLKASGEYDALRRKFDL